MGWSLWLAFVAVALVAALSPGPGAVLSMASGLRHGYRGALRAIAGLQTALVLQLAVVALGLGALLATSETAFVVVKVLGAAYLIWLGLQQWRAPVEAIDAGAASGEVRDPRERRKLYARGVLVNLTNPKAVVFMAALVPQFIVPTAPQWPQFLSIGATMVAIDVVVMSGYALLGARFRTLLCNPRALRVQNRVFGSLFVGAGTVLAASSR